MHFHVEKLLLEPASTSLGFVDVGYSKSIIIIIITQSMGYSQTKSRTRSGPQSKPVNSFTESV